MMYLWARVYLLLDVRSVQTWIDRDAAAFKKALKNPGRVQGKKRDRARIRKVLEETSAMHLAPGASIAPGSDAEDPWKGAFGGSYRDDNLGRELSATVTPIENSEYCTVRLSVRSTDASAKPLSGTVSPK